MTAQVIFIHTWPDCPDHILRFHYILQEKISEGKARFWYDLGDIDRYQKMLCYDRWIHSNRDRLKVVVGGNLADIKETL
jgi:hypothetical protein